MGLPGMWSRLDADGAPGEWVKASRRWGSWGYGQSLMLMGPARWGMGQGFRPMGLLGNVRTGPGEGGSAPLQEGQEVLRAAGRAVGAPGPFFGRVRLLPGPGTCTSLGHPLIHKVIFAPLIIAPPIISTVNSVVSACVRSRCHNFASITLSLFLRLLVQ